MATNTHILWHLAKPPHEAPAAETLSPLQSLAASPAIERHLPRHCFIRLLGDHTGEQVACLCGVVWITQPGNQDDFLISAGEIFTIPNKEPVLIESLVDASLEITPQEMEGFYPDGQ